MKQKHLLIMLLVLTVLALTACGGSGAAQSAAAQGASSVNTTPQPPQNGEAQTGNNIPEMPLELKLVLGTFKLDQTNNPVTAEQAANLLPLWKAALSLSQSDTTAAAEMEALVKQIQGAMTPEQVTAIDAMNLTFQDMQTIADQLGLSMGFGEGSGTMDPSVRATAQAMRQNGQTPPEGFFRGSGGGDGGPPGGGQGGGGGFIPGGGGQGSGIGSLPAATQTAIAQRRAAGRGGSLGVNRALLNALITFLEGKMQ